MASVRRRIAPATLISPFLAHSVGEEGGPGGMVRAALTPGPSPALRERGELVHGLGAAQNRPCNAHLPLPLPVWERKGARGGWCGQPSPPAPLPRCGRGGSWFMASVQRRIAPATLISPFLSPCGRGRGLGGCCGQPSPPAPLPRCGRGGSWFMASVRRRIAPATLISPFLSPCGRGRGLGGWCGQPSPPAPLPRCGRGGGSWFVNAAALTDAGSPLQRSSSPFLAHSVGEEGGPGGMVRGGAIFYPLSFPSSLRPPRLAIKRI
jgi:hypothetical protein